MKQIGSLLQILASQIWYYIKQIFVLDAVRRKSILVHGAVTEWEI